MYEMVPAWLKRPCRVYCSRTGSDDDVEIVESTAEGKARVAAAAAAAAAAVAAQYDVYVPPVHDPVAAQVAAKLQCVLLVGCAGVAAVGVGWPTGRVLPLQVA
jgi:hypothetical protein